MASFVNANLGSDSESDDQDYDPTQDGSGEVLSEEEGSGVDEEGMASTKTKAQKNKKKKKEKIELGKRTGGLFIEETDTKAEEEERKKEFDMEKVEKKEEEEKKKMDDLWADFNKDVVPSKPNAAVAASKPIGSGLGSFGRWSSKPKTSTSVIKKAPKSVFSSIFDNIDSEKNLTTEESTPPPPIRTVFSSVFEKMKESVSPESDKTNDSKDDNVDQITITKVFDFAGESVEVSKQVSKDSKEGQQFLKQTEAAPAATASCGLATAATSVNKRPGGLNSVIGLLSGKKPKLGTLDKSKMDWNTFIEQEGIKEELQTHNKGKDGYVEKQMFLDQVDQRRFEIEKAAREKTRKTLNR